jgi:hypothetical protein
MPREWTFSRSNTGRRTPNTSTSLVVAIELSDGGDVLLFAADAQVGNWLYIGGGKARERSGGRGCASR